MAAHTASTPALTLYRVSEKRGEVTEGLEGGVIVHDHFKPYYSLPGVEHALIAYLTLERRGRALTPPRDRELSHKRVRTGNADQRVRTGNADQDQFRASLTVTLQLELRICLLARQRIARSFIKTVSHCQGCVRRVLLDARRRIFQEVNDITDMPISDSAY
jgi:hypothetical protein